MAAFSFGVTALQCPSPTNWPLEDLEIPLSHFTWPVQGTNVSVSSSVFHGEMFPRAGINPSLTTFNALRWFWEWYEYFFPVFAISLSDFGSFSGNLESLEHFPQQQCFVLTIFNWNYLDYLSHLVLFAFRHLICLFESCGGSYKTYISIFRTTHCAMRPSVASAEEEYHREEQVAGTSSVQFQSPPSARGYSIETPQTTKLWIQMIQKAKRTI